MKFSVVILFGAAFGRRHFFTRVEELLDSTTEYLAEAQDFLQNEVKPAVEDLHESTEEFSATVQDFSATV